MRRNRPGPLAAHRARPARARRHRGSARAALSRVHRPWRAPQCGTTSYV